MLNKKCAVCGKEFQTKTGIAKYCSDECRAKVGQKPVTYKPIITEHVCRWCGESFETSNGCKKYCSDQCRLEAKHKAKRTRYRETSDRTPRTEPDSLTVKQETAFLKEQKKSKDWRKGNKASLNAASQEASVIGVTYGVYVSHRDTMSPKSFEEWKQKKKKEYFLEKSKANSELD